jgi:hypothetical protein
MRRCSPASAWTGHALPERGDRASWLALGAVFAGAFAQRTRDEWVTVDGTRINIEKT